MLFRSALRRRGVDDAAGDDAAEQPEQRGDRQQQPELADRDADAVADLRCSRDERCRHRTVHEELPGDGDERPLITRAERRTRQGFGRYQRLDGGPSGATPADPRCFSLCAHAQAIQLGIEYDPQPPFDTGSVKKAPAELVQAITGIKDIILYGAG